MLLICTTELKVSFCFQRIRHPYLLTLLKGVCCVRHPRDCSHNRDSKPRLALQSASDFFGQMIFCNEAAHADDGEDDILSAETESDSTVMVKVSLQNIPPNSTNQFLACIT